MRNIPDILYYTASFLLPLPDIDMYHHTVIYVVCFVMIIDTDYLMRTLLYMAI